MDESDFDEDAEPAVFDRKARSPTPQPSSFQKWGGLLASLILVWVLGCPVAGLAGIAYQQWIVQPGPTMSWQALLVILGAWLAIGLVFSTYFVVRALRN